MPFIAATLIAATAVPAAPAPACPPASVCASAPETVTAALVREGYQAKRTTDGEGDPRIDSAAAGYHFSIEFYGCALHERCDSLRFVTEVDGDRGVLPLINEWNRTNRFATLQLDGDGATVMSYDVTTVGGLSDSNFADVLDWWTTKLGNLDVFLRAHPHAPLPSAPVRSAPPSAAPPSAAPPSAAPPSAAPASSASAPARA